jgi:integrase/recombinase XerD
MNAVVVEQPRIRLPLLPAFREELAVRGRAPSTCAAYAADLELFRSFLVGGRPGEPDWGVLPPSAIGAYLAHERRTGKAPATLVRRAAALRAFCAWLERRGIVGRGLAAAVPRRLGRVRVELDALDDDALGRLRAAPDARTAAGLRDAALLALLCSAGLRTSEAVGLDAGELDLASLWVRSAGRERWRLVELEEDTRAALAGYLRVGRPRLVRKRPDEGALFVNVRGERLTRQGAWLRVLAHGRSAGLPGPVTPALLRRSVGLGLLRRGAPPAEVGALLGCSGPGWVYRLRGALAGSPAANRP